MNHATAPHYGPARQRGEPVFSGVAHATAEPVSLHSPYAGETYYDVPPVRSGPYGWLIVAYFFIGGVASAGQFIATVADLVGEGRDATIVRAGRYLALVGALVSPILLIADLHHPRRWFNMLRIYRNQSAMSIGSWALALFGAFSGLTAAGQFLADLRVGLGSTVARLAQLPAAAAGGIVALYTGTLMAATNMPFTASAFPFLSSLFASSAASTAAAALTIAAETGGASADTWERLNRFALLSGIVEGVFLLLVLAGWRRDRAAEPLKTARLRLAYRGGVLGLGVGLPVALHAAQAVSRRDSRGRALLAAGAALVGGFLLRAVFVFGGNASAERPRDYFRFTEPK